MRTRLPQSKQRREGPRLRRPVPLHLDHLGRQLVLVHRVVLARAVVIDREPRPEEREHPDEEAEHDERLGAVRAGDLDPSTDVQPGIYGRHSHTQAGVVVTRIYTRRWQNAR